MTTVSIIFDLLALAILVVCAFYYAGKGLLKSILGLAGSLLSVVAANIISRNLASAVFSQFIRPAIEEKAVSVMQEYGASTMQDILGNMAGFLPEVVTGTLSSTIEQTISTGAHTFAVRVVDELIEPFVVPVIAVILFFLLFSLFRLVLGMLIALIAKAQELPVISTANKVLGAALGVLIGAIYVFLLVALIQVVDYVFNAAAATEGYFGGSIFYQLFSVFSFVAR